jgi:hypothetical protein
MLENLKKVHGLLIRRTGSTGPDASQMTAEGGAGYLNPARRQCIENTSNTYYPSSKGKHQITDHLPT